MTTSLSNCQVIEGSSRPFYGQFPSNPHFCYFCLQELPTVHSYEALNMGLLEGELWSTDKDVHNKTYMNDHQENDVFYKKTVETHTLVEKDGAARGPHKNGKPPHLLIIGSWSKVENSKALVYIIFHLVCLDF